MNFDTLGTFGYNANVCYLQFMSNEYRIEYRKRVLL